MKKLVAVAQLALCFVFVYCNSGGGQTRPSELVGHWIHGSGHNYSNKMELFKDGTGVCQGNTISWKVESKRFVIMSSEFGTTCNYKVSGYELTLIFDDGDSTIFVKNGKLEEFKAKQAAAAEAEKAKKIADAKKSVGTFNDSRDGKTYRKVTIGGQTWMAENLNYAADNSVCYENSAENCAKYGRLYNWSTAKQACPTGWHLPNYDEWDVLVDYAGGRKTAGTKLRSSTGWNGTNEYLFSALPGGIGFSNGNFSSAGNGGYWWSATESINNRASYRNMDYYNEYVNVDFNSKNFKFSVRCVEDDKSEQAFKRGNEALDKGRGELNISSPNNLKGGALTGGRSRASIQRVVMQNMASLRYVYDRRLRERPGLEGKIMVKFTIEEFGKVISAQVMESTMDDSELERTVVDRVKSWDFDKIDKPGDVTEVVYPFVFSQ